MIRTIHPVLPSRAIPVTLEFYQRAGFSIYHQFGEEYAIITRDGQEIHFFGYPDVQPETSVQCIYVRVMDADALYRELQAQGIVGTSPPEDKEWGQREFAVVDPDGTLIRFAQALEVPRVS